MKYQHMYHKMQQVKRNMGWGCCGRAIECNRTGEISTSLSLIETRQTKYGVGLLWAAQRVQQNRGNINIFIIKCNKPNEIWGAVAVAGPKNATKPRKHQHLYHKMEQVKRNMGWGRAIECNKTGEMSTSL